MNIIFFDGICNLCNDTVQFVIKNEAKNTFKFAALQSDFAQKELKKYHKNSTELNSIYLLKNNHLYTKSSAALRIAKELKFPYKLIFVFIIIPKFIRDFMYDFIAKNRYKWFGRKEHCTLPTPELNNRFLK